jgi:hypothetical protein
MQIILGTTRSIALLLSIDVTPETGARGLQTSELNWRRRRVDVRKHDIIQRTTWRRWKRRCGEGALSLGTGWPVSERFAALAGFAMLRGVVSGSLRDPRAQSSCIQVSYIHIAMPSHNIVVLAGRHYFEVWNFNANGFKVTASVLR